MKLTAIGALGLMATSLFAQGLNPGAQTKESWEEINFEFNSSILSDGYPSLLRLADIMAQHPDYKLTVTGNTDIVGSAAYNDKLAMARAEAVKAFLVKYGAHAGQISTSGNGKRDPEVDNKTKEGRFMNRRVVMELRDGNGKLIGAGGISDVVPDVLKNIQDMLKQQADCCAQILKRLDKLDDILAALKGLQGDNDRLKSELADTRNQLNSLKDQVNGLPKPVTEPQAQSMINAAQEKTEEAQKARMNAISNVGINVGPAFLNGRPNNSHIAASAYGMFFQPFGREQHYALQAQGRYNYFPGFQEGQFDLGLVDRVGPVQAGAFSSFKYIDFGQFQHGAVVAQADFLVDYLFNGGKVGLYGTEAFKPVGVLNSMLLAPGAYEQTIARVDNQFGFSATVGAWGNAYIRGNAGAIFTHYQGNKPGFNIGLVQPIIPHLAFTADFGYNENYVAQHSNIADIRFGLMFGGILNPKEFGKDTRPAPMDVPEIRYELAQRRVGASPPIANAGPNQINVPQGTITLNGSASYDPLGETLTYAWSQVSGPPVQLSSANAAIATFPGLLGQTYVFKLTVTNTDHLSASATTEVKVMAASPVSVATFTASPSTIQPGGTSTLSWVVLNATTVTISPGVGSVNAGTGSTQVSPAATTTYTMTATGPAGTVTSSVVVTVSTAAAPGPQILMFNGSPLSITAGQSSTLSWTTQNATAVTISGLGAEPLNGSVSTGVLQTTTTYTLTATGPGGTQVTAVITIQVAPASVPQVVVFTASPQTISAGQSSQLCWQVIGATSISISNGIGSNLQGNACQTISPQTTTTYVLTATNASGQIQASVTVNVGSTMILSFTASPEFSPIQGGPVTLTWTTQNATSVALVGGDMSASPANLPVNGSITVNPNDNATYTLIAYGAGGSSVSAVISVYVR